jgi:uncharacterized protein (TIGR02246 family)
MRARFLCFLCLALLMFGPADTREIDAQGKDKGKDKDNPEAVAIRKQGEAFVEAFHKGDAKAVAAFWTLDGDYTDPAGQLLKGRDAIEKVFAGLFAEHKDLKIKIDSTSLRFVTPDVAIEDGTSAVFAPGMLPTNARFTNVLVKKDGKWLLSSVRESPLAASNNYRHLRGLDWTIGEWIGEPQEGIVEHVAVAWSDNQNFITATLMTTVKNIPVGSATLRTGWDPLAKHMRSWMFDGNGGFGEGTWFQAGKKWLAKTSSILHDGKKMDATFVFTPIDDNTIGFQMKDRSEDGTKLPDTKEMKLKRVQ